ncbi:MAG: alpha/beta hydrolase [Chloroflexota bacterium]
MPHSNEHLIVNGKRLEVAWHGPSPDEAPTILFLHEGLGCVSLWRDFPARVAEATGCGALVYSRLGYGGSDPCDLPRPLRYMHDEGLAVLPALLEVAGIHDCILVGHSDGGSIALIYAGGTPALPVRGVITEAAHVFCEEICVEAIQAIQKPYYEGNLRAKLQKYHGDNVDCAFLGWSDSWLHPEFMDWNLEEYLPGIKVPLLAIQGKDDQYGTEAQVESIARQAGAGAEVVMIDDCGHTPHREQTEITFEAMVQFIKTLLT